MSIKNQRQLENTRTKLHLLEKSYFELKEQPGPNAHVDELTLRSLKKLINQLKEEIARFEARASVTAKDD